MTNICIRKLAILVMELTLLFVNTRVKGMNQEARWFLIDNEYGSYDKGKKYKIYSDFINVEHTSCTGAFIAGMKEYTKTSSSLENAWKNKDITFTLARNNDNIDFFPQRIGIW